MTRILGISGSLRSGSHNTALLHAAKAAAGSGVEFEAVTLHGIPLYDGDVERDQGLPAAVLALKDKVTASDGVLLVTPEYNNGVPGVFKNAIDWLSRPPDDIARMFRGRPFALIGASQGSFGTILAQNGWLPTMRTLGVRLYTESRLMVSRANSVFDERGELKDDAVRQQLAKFVEGFARFAAERAPPR